MIAKFGMAAQNWALIRVASGPKKLCGATLVSYASAIAALASASRRPFQMTSTMATSIAPRSRNAW